MRGKEIGKWKVRSGYSRSVPVIESIPVFKRTANMLPNFMLCLLTGFIRFVPLFTGYVRLLLVITPPT